MAAGRARYLDRGQRVVADAAEFRLTCRAVRPWAQWRLQGRFASSKGGAAEAACPWCGGAELDAQLSPHRPSAAQAARDAAAGTAWEGAPAAELARRCVQDADVLTGVAVAARLAAGPWR